MYILYNVDMLTELTIKGRVPSKKNSKVMKCFGGRPMLIANKKFQDWNEEKRWELRSQNRSTCIGISSMTLAFYAPDKRKTDLTNKAESIMDLLVDEQIIVDDNWDEVPELKLVYGGLDRDNPRVEVYIHHDKKA